MVIFFKKTINKMLMRTALSKVNGSGNVVYLTFDDGPEEGITDFVLDQLSEYGFKATFFCTGRNAELHPGLMQKIIDDGHTLANHTYSHLISYNVSADEYVDNVDKAAKIIPSSLMRPPCGCLTFLSWIRLFRKYNIVYWSLNSGDSDLTNFDYDSSIKALGRTRPGDIVLFHFCHKHERETRILLPEYIAWLNEHGYRSEGLRNAK